MPRRPERFRPMMAYWDGYLLGTGSAFLVSAFAMKGDVAVAFSVVAGLFLLGHFFFKQWQHEGEDE